MKYSSYMNTSREVVLSVLPTCHEMSTSESNVVSKGNGRHICSIGTRLEYLLPNTA